jgi:uncharacterized protein YyaL (SSP411 family)
VSHDHEPLFHRAKSAEDHATPSGNGIAALALNRLGHVAAEPRFCAAAARALRTFKSRFERQPAAHASLCAALEEELAPPTIVILRGGTGLEAWQRAINRRYLPHTLVLAIPAAVPGLPAALERPATSEVNAWVCRGVTCLPPITDRDQLFSLLSAPRTAVG